MTWPWILHLRDAASDSGDPYLVSWVLWWDYHQTFNDPLNLFQANIFFPYRYSLAFSEHSYGVAVFFFPLFALGVRPLTVHGIATLVGFAFSGYGAFRLARTLTGSTATAWITGIVFAFAPYRFAQLPHLMYLNAGWIPILLEALVLFIRRATPKRAVWLGAAFFLNALACTHWFVLTLLPLAFTAAFLLTCYGKWRDRTLWKLGLSALAIASLLLLPFFIPFVRAARLYGFVRHFEETLSFSALPSDWLVGVYRNKLWHGLNNAQRAGERELFPGFLPPLLMLAAILLVNPGHTTERRRTTGLLLLFLDFTLIVSAILAVLISGYAPLSLPLVGQVHSANAVIITFVITLVVTLVIARPKLLVRSKVQQTSPGDLGPEAFWVGIIWTTMGFAGSLGLNFFFHRVLYEYVPLFRSMRVPARWAMICCLGLALLAGIGATNLAKLLRRHFSSLKPAPLFVAIAIVILFEQRAAPLELIRGEVDPDQLTMRLKATNMVGGIVELPFDAGGRAVYKYTLRAADHGRPLITATSGFVPPIQLQIQALSESNPVPDKFFDLLESIPASYLVVHNDLLEPDAELNLQQMLQRGTARKRLRFVNSYEGKSDLYAVIKNEPEAKTEALIPDYLLSPSDVSDINALRTLPFLVDDADSFTRAQYQDVLGRDPDPEGLRYWIEQIQRCDRSIVCRRDAAVRVSAALFSSEEFEQTAFYIYRLYVLTLGRHPRYSEFASDRAALRQGVLDESKSSFVNEWFRRREFIARYPATLSNEAFVDQLLRNVKDSLPHEVIADRKTLIGNLNNGESRTTLVRRIVEQKTSWPLGQNRAVVLLQYFVYLKRDPEPEGYAFWVRRLEQRGPDAYQSTIRSFLGSNEYLERFTATQTAR